MAKRVTVARRIEIHFADLVNDLAYQRSRLHVIVGVLENTLNYHSTLSILTVEGQTLL